MKELKFLHNFKVSVLDCSSSIQFRAALDIGNVDYQTSDEKFGIIFNLDNSKSTLPDLVYTTIEELNSLGLYHQIWDVVDDSCSWAIRRDSRLRAKTKTLESIFSFIQKNREVFLRNWAESNKRSVQGLLEKKTSTQIRSNFTNSQRSIDCILSAISNGEPLSLRDALKLANGAKTSDLALAVTLSRSAQQIVTTNKQYIHRLNLVQPKTSSTRFRKRRNRPQSQAQLLHEMLNQVGRFESQGGELVLIDASLPSLMTLSHLEELILRLSNNFRLKIMIYGTGFIEQLAARSNIDTATCLRRLRNAGVQGLLDDDSCSSIKSWLNILDQAHYMGLYSSSLAIKRSEDSWLSFVLKLYRTRRLHEITGGFEHFTPLVRISEYHNNESFIDDYLRVLSISRLFLPKELKIHSSAKRMGGFLSSLALSYGADSIGYVETSSASNYLNLKSEIEFERKQNIDSALEKKTVNY